VFIALSRLNNIYVLIDSMLIKQAGEMGLIFHLVTINEQGSGAVTILTHQVVPPGLDSPKNHQMRVFIQGMEEQP
jgi:hypothetical protein